MTAARTQCRVHAASSTDDFCSCAPGTCALGYDRSAEQGHGVPLMEGLRNLEKGYDRKFALAYCVDDVWAALEALEAIIAVPSERTLLLNAEARAMYEIAKRALEVAA